MKKLSSIPVNDGFYMPGEYHPHLGTLMIWPERPGSWGYGGGPAKRAFKEIILSLAEDEKVFLFASKDGVKEAAEVFEDCGEKLKQNIIIIEFPTDDSWARDTGATFLLSKSGKILRGIDWQFNAWGGNFDGLYASWDRDKLVAERICKELDVDIYDARDFVLEGGSIHTDGEGTLITTEECLLSKGRNPHMTKAEIEEKLKDYLGVEKIIWLPFGIYNDETNGHVDNICCFAKPGQVILATTGNKNDPQWERSQMALDVLKSKTDAMGRNIEVIELPIPEKPIIITEEDLKGLAFEEDEDQREVGERLAASYVNFYIANGKVLVPQFDDVNDSVATKILGDVFPEREIVPIYARDILVGGGNIHCITQQIPMTI